MGSDLTGRYVSLLAPLRKRFLEGDVDPVGVNDTSAGIGMKYIAIDAMGGDFGPSVVVEGVALAYTQLQQSSGNCVRFVFFGDEDAINAQLEKYPNLLSASSVVHTDVIVTNEMKPIDALRHKEDSNLGMALHSVASGRTHAVVSAANTGAYVTLAKVILETLPGIDRPAIPAVMPNRNGMSVVLDLGANLECSPERLVQFALMGEVLARALLKKSSPTVGLLNVGSEEMKGNAIVQTTGQMLHSIDKITKEDASLDRFNFRGFVEGNDIFGGAADVIVTDGFSGNIALKAIEGVILFLFDLIRESGKKSLLHKLLALLMLPLLKNVKQTIDPRLYNGAVFLGLNKIAVKSHGSADPFSFAKAVCVAVNMAQSNFSDEIERRLQLVTKIQ
ncbi:MAG: phosphate acyltransferase PlsX [Holosporales bacterium]|nr:phosphate acyltransferase PlsX [Holosporales bacterium]